MVKCRLRGCGRKRCRWPRPGSCHAQHCACGPHRIPETCRAGRCPGRPRRSALGSPCRGGVLPDAAVPVTLSQTSASTQPTARLKAARGPAPSASRQSRHSVGHPRPPGRDARLRLLGLFSCHVPPAAVRARGPRAAGLLALSPVARGAPLTGPVTHPPPRPFRCRHRAPVPTRTLFNITERASSAPYRDCAERRPLRPAPEGDEQHVLQSGLRRSPGRSSLAPGSPTPLTAATCPLLGARGNGDLFPRRRRSLL